MWKNLFSCSNTSKNEFVSQDRSLFDFSVSLSDFLKRKAVAKIRQLFLTSKFFRKKFQTFFRRTKSELLSLKRKSECKGKTTFLILQIFFQKSFQKFLRTIFCVPAPYQSRNRVQSNNIKMIFANFLITFLQHFLDRKYNSTMHQAVSSKNSFKRQISTI